MSGAGIILNEGAEGALVDVRTKFEACRGAVNSAQADFVHQFRQGVTSCWCLLADQVQMCPKVLWFGTCRHI